VIPYSPSKAAEKAPFCDTTMALFNMPHPCYPAALRPARRTGFKRKRVKKLKNNIGLGAFLDPSDL
jgi:hypothetical protein